MMTTLGAVLLSYLVHSQGTSLGMAK
jgi:hypothetical protein